MISTLRRVIGHRSPLRIAWHYGKSFTAAVLYGFPARKLTVIGITGTDGKTTTVGMTAHILRYSGYKVGALSTAFFQINDEITWNETQKTSPSPFAIQRFLRELVQKKCTHVVLEYSSHGLVQGRTAYTWPSAAGITNTSEEHLDYHGSIEQYRKDKGILFKMIRRSGTKVLNTNDDSFCMYKTISTKKTICYGSNMVDPSQSYWASTIQQSPTGSSAILHESDSSTTFELALQIPGVFNIDNAMCAISLASAVGVQTSTAIEALQTFTGVPGRMERIHEGQDFSVFVDFTVTPNAYKKTLSTLRNMIQPNKRILVLTGSCGDRMKEKRPIVGRICSEMADVVVISNEDPYTEDPQKIIDEVWDGVDQTKAESHKIFDRKEAIEFLCRSANSGDVVILCAKGSDTTMWTAEGQIPWNEREITSAILRSL